MLLPHLNDLLIRCVRTEVDAMVVVAAVATSMARCTGCRTPSSRAYSRYRHRLADAAVAGRRMALRLVVRRFFCVDADCRAKTFAE
ncbi:transposase family protein [Nocardia sp. NPDC051052]|uniref:transposase family protein n=1 Tax=Nocardia sp. NPDC051052 TaxID=3364322 RepID=UPI0037B01C0D